MWRLLKSIGFTCKRFSSEFGFHKNGQTLVARDLNFFRLRFQFFFLSFFVCGFCFN